MYRHETRDTRHVHRYAREISGDKREERRSRVIVRDRIGVYRQLCEWLVWVMSMLVCEWVSSALLCGSSSATCFKSAIATRKFASKHLIDGFWYAYFNTLPLFSVQSCSTNRYLLSFLFDAFSRSVGSSMVFNRTAFIGYIVYEAFTSHRSGSLIKNPRIYLIFTSAVWIEFPWKPMISRFVNSISCVSSENS